jgi:hypothetical protein
MQVKDIFDGVVDLWGTLQCLRQLIDLLVLRYIQIPAALLLIVDR